MYLSKLTIENFRCYGSGDDKIEINLGPGLTAFVGANDAGKSAIIDALRFAFGTSDQERLYLDPTDFHAGTSEIVITCKFEGLTAADQGTFSEHLNYGEGENPPPIFCYTWRAKETGELRKGRPYRRIDVCSGADGTGPAIPSDVRLLMQATYLRPLRDAGEALSAGRGSRLAQVLVQSDLVKSGVDACDLEQPLRAQQLSVLGIAKLLTSLLGTQQGVHETREKIDQSLQALSLHGDELRSAIKVNDAEAADERQLRELLEKLDLRLNGAGRLGLGSDNLLYMACELLLIRQEESGNKLLLIEEPEAHLHAQRQLQVMRSLQEQAKQDGIQVIVTTHSPNLASVISLDHLVICRRRRAFSLARAATCLKPDDYRFLERFLDATKANLFFAYGVLIVEGDAENILLPTVARLLGQDLTRYGVSVVNVGGIGLGRYARIFQRKRFAEEGSVGIRVACLTDLDIMPDCAPYIIGKVEVGQPWPAKDGKRRWRARRDIGNAEDLANLRTRKVASLEGQDVKAFVAEGWTLEYDLALGPQTDAGRFEGGLAKDLYVAAALAGYDAEIANGEKAVAQVALEAENDFDALKRDAQPADGCTVEEVIAVRVYARFSNDGVSKAIAAQFLAARLADRFEKGTLTADAFRRVLPRYVVQAIDYLAPIPAPKA